jgi:uncharacterized protein YuzE
MNCNTVKKEAPVTFRENKEIGFNPFIFEYNKELNTVRIYFNNRDELEIATKKTYIFEKEGVSINTIADYDKIFYLEFAKPEYIPDLQFEEVSIEYDKLEDALYISLISTDNIEIKLCKEWKYTIMIDCDNNHFVGIEILDVSKILDVVNKLKEE